MQYRVVWYRAKNIADCLCVAYYTYVIACNTFRFQDLTTFAITISWSNKSLIENRSFCMISRAVYFCGEWSQWHQNVSSGHGIPLFLTECITLIISREVIFFYDKDTTSYKDGWLNYVATEENHHYINACLHSVNIDHIYELVRFLFVYILRLIQLPETPFLLTEKITEPVSDLRHEQIITSM